jgi:hypothetical protein
MERFKSPSEIESFNLNDLDVELLDDRFEMTVVQTVTAPGSCTGYTHCDQYSA